MGPQTVGPDFQGRASNQLDLEKCSTELSRGYKSRAAELGEGMPFLKWLAGVKLMFIKVHSARTKNTQTVLCQFRQKLADYRFAVFVALC